MMFVGGHSSAIVNRPQSGEGRSPRKAQRPSPSIGRAWLESSDYARRNQVLGAKIQVRRQISNDGPWALWRW